MHEMTAIEIKTKMDQGELTARKLVDFFLARINQLNQNGPRLGAVLELNPEAVDIAESLDAERNAGQVRGPLHGIPILIKDNIDTADKMTTTAGSLALKGSIALKDSQVAKKLREAGAIILGKTNMSEWANFRSTRSCSGWSSRGGQTKNPYVLNRSPIGSSSGSAAAVAAGLSPLAIGTETNGSIISPSSACSLVGIKPTVGLVGRSGIIPISHTQDTAGPMTRTVADAAFLLSALVGEDDRDPITNEATARAESDYTAFLDPEGLGGARIGVARAYFGFNKKTDKLIEAAIEAMKNCGAEIIDPIEMPAIKQLTDSGAGMDVLAYEFKDGLNRYLAGLSPDVQVKSLEEIIEFNEKNRQEVMPYFDQEILRASQAKGPLTDDAYIESLKLCRRLSREEGIDAVMSEHKLDAIVAPSCSPSFHIDLVNGDGRGKSCPFPAAVAGYPHITVPAGYIQGLPVGVSFFGAAYSEKRLIKLAFSFEQATMLRRPPEFKPDADL